MWKERKLWLQGVLEVVVPVLAFAALLLAAYVMERVQEDSIAAKEVTTGPGLNLN